MKWNPKDQITMFDLLESSVDSKPKEKRLEPKHFDDTQTNPNFVSYLLATGKKVGEPYRMSVARKWIDEQVVKFKRDNGRSEYEMLNTIDNWPDKLREYLRELSK